MSIIAGVDARGHYFYRFGLKGKKFYYDPNNQKSRNDARRKASLDHKAAIKDGRLMNASS